MNVYVQKDTFIFHCIHNTTQTTILFNDDGNIVERILPKNIFVKINKNEKCVEFSNWETEYICGDLEQKGKLIINYDGKNGEILDIIYEEKNISPSIIIRFICFNELISLHNIFDVDGHYTHIKYNIESKTPNINFLLDGYYDYDNLSGTSEDVEILMF